MTKEVTAFAKRPPVQFVHNGDYDKWRNPGTGEADFESGGLDLTPTHVGPTVRWTDV